MAGRAGSVAGRFCRVKPLRHARALVLGLLADLPCKNCWTIAEHAGQATPDSLQYLLAAAAWDEHEVRDHLGRAPRRPGRGAGDGRDCAGRKAGWTAVRARLASRAGHWRMRMPAGTNQTRQAEHVREPAPSKEREHHVGTITTADGTEIFYKDWGSGQPIVFSHGWPLSADDWDTQMLFFLQHGYRVIAHDRRGHGRSTQTSDGHDMDHYADDLAALMAHLDLQNAVHVGHSTGGGEVVHYLARHGETRVAKAVLISAVPPLMVKTAANPGGLPKEVFDGFQAQLAASRSKFYRDLAAGPFYGFNRPGVEASEPLIQNWWRQGMMGGAKAHYDGIVAFSQTDFTEDLKTISVPVLVMHGDDDQIVPYADSGPLSAKLVKNGTLKTYRGFPHGMPTTQAETINADLLAFLEA
jgi:non-heme chloroperoxidase